MIVFKYSELIKYISWFGTNFSHYIIFRTCRSITIFSNTHRVVNMQNGNSTKISCTQTAAATAAPGTIGRCDQVRRQLIFGRWGDSRT